MLNFLPYCLLDNVMSLVEEDRVNKNTSKIFISIFEKGLVKEVTTINCQCNWFVDIFPQCFK